jgi:hypothetical protein
MPWKMGCENDQLRSEMRLVLHIITYNGFDIYDRCSVQCFEWLYFYFPCRTHPRYFDPVQTNRVGPFGRSGGKYSHRWQFFKIARVTFYHRTVRLMKPGEYNDLITRFHSIEPPGKFRKNFNSCFRRPFIALQRAILELFQRRVNNADRIERHAAKLQIISPGCNLFPGTSVYCCISLILILAL